MNEFTNWWSPGLNAVALFVPGKPQPAGSKKAFALTHRDGSPVRRSPGGAIAVNVVDDNDKAKPWQHNVKYHANRVWRASGDPFDGPVSVSMQFIQQWRKIDLSAKGGPKPRASSLNVTKPDALKLARGVEDALTGIAWKDDAQICDESIRKCYGTRPGVWITVVRLRPDGDPIDVEAMVGCMRWVQQQTNPAANLEPNPFANAVEGSLFG